MDGATIFRILRLVKTQRPLIRMGDKASPCYGRIILWIVLVEGIQRGISFAEIAHVIVGAARD